MTDVVRRKGRPALTPRPRPDDDDDDDDDDEAT